MRALLRVRWNGWSKVFSSAVVAMLTISAMLSGASAQAQTTSINAFDLDYGISGRQSNSFQFDFSSEAIWTAGSQRSENGSADAGNQRAGRVFVDFQLTPSLISAAQQALTIPGSTISLTFAANSIGQGVAGVPYTDGLDLRYLGISASNRDAAALWNAPGIGTDQADILAVAGATGSHTVELTNTSLLNNIASASAGQFLSFGMSNSTGINLSQPVGNSTAQTYGFQMSQGLGVALAVNVNTPEPATVVMWSLLGVVGVGFALVRGGRKLPLAALVRKQ